MKKFIFFIKRHYPHLFPLNRRRFEAVGVLSFTKTQTWKTSWGSVGRFAETFCRAPMEFVWSDISVSTSHIFPFNIYFLQADVSQLMLFFYIYFLQDDVALWMNEWVVVELGSLSVTSTDVSLSIIETLEMRRKSRNFTEEITEISGVRSRPWRPSVAIGGRPCSIFHFPIFPI